MEQQQTMPLASTAAGQIPVCGHADACAVLAHTRKGPVTVGQWLRDARALLMRLPAQCGHLVNICEDRYHFLVGFGACLLGGKVSLQPSSLTPAAWSQLLRHAPDAVCLHNETLPELPVGKDVPCLHVGESLCAPGCTTPQQTPDDAALPTIPAGQVVAQVFTSGSTGVPVGHAKTWGKLCRNVRAEAQLLGLMDGAQAWCLVGTVPSQHMYGFESVVLQALAAGHSVWGGRPFYPADVADALAAAPQPRMLVTTPVHLKALLESGVAFAEVERILCATAPLPLELARKAQAVLRAPVYEIYGSTETGQIAVRQPVQGPQWTLFPDVELELHGEKIVASGGHLEGRIPLSDVIEKVDARRFVLHGRSADMVNIAGKRSSLGYLNSMLERISAVRDGAFFLPDNDAQAQQQADVQRLCLVACAPGLQAEELMGLLRQHIDAVFLPRPLILLEHLPRNATGKLPRSALQEIYERHMAKQPLGAGAQAGPAAQPLPWQPEKGACKRWQVPLQHPACDGHFPGHPVLPGAVLLQHCLDLCSSLAPHAGGRWQVQSVKFLQTCHPGDVLDVVVEPQAAAAGAGAGLAARPEKAKACAAPVAWAFRVLRDQSPVMSGVAQVASGGIC